MSFQAWLTPAIAAAAFLAMTLAETLAPLRRRVEPRGVRLGRNLALAGVSYGFFSLLQTPFVVPIAEWTARRGVGLAQALPVPPAARVLVAVLVLDYTLWIWHWANHKVPFLWRFHLVHHVDRDLDASTALRFHVGEMALSVPVRALQVVVAGADPLALWLWQAVLFVSILFHHSNARLPLALERVLVRVFVTPRMHGIHHSDRLDETNTNWSSLLSVWDYLHRTIRLDVPQAEIVIGVPAYAAPGDVTLGRSFAIPFLNPRDDFRAPDGRLLVRGHGPGGAAELRA
ncbi:MAG TPA: sterol desaturase family protein [Thermoanaerobaculia bacterium]|nr:sterol desaturase family protein [Thermoanaerobaculia bacterium]